MKQLTIKKKITLWYTGIIAVVLGTILVLVLLFVDKVGISATEEEISQFSAVFMPDGGVKRLIRPTFALISAAPSGNHAYSYEYFLVRRVGAVFAGSSGQTCLG